MAKMTSLNLILYSLLAKVDLPAECTYSLFVSLRRRDDFDDHSFERLSVAQLWHHPKMQFTRGFAILIPTERKEQGHQFGVLRQLFWI